VKSLRTSGSHLELSSLADPFASLFASLPNTPVHGSLLDAAAGGGGGGSLLFNPGALHTHLAQLQPRAVRPPLRRWH
jgi:hypothetical protein